MSQTTLELVSDYFDDARVLLQDLIPDYRYDEPSLLTALNVTFLEVRRLRPDLIIFNYPRGTPKFTKTTEQVCMEEQFRLGVLFGVVGHALARDQEDYQDVRATDFMARFSAVMLGTALPKISGGDGPGDGPGTRGGAQGGA